MARGNGLTVYDHPKPKARTDKEVLRAKQEVKTLDAMTAPCLTPHQISVRADLALSVVNASLARLKGVCVKATRDKWSLM